MKKIHLPFKIFDQKTSRPLLFVSGLAFALIALTFGSSTSHAATLCVVSGELVETGVPAQELSCRDANDIEVEECKVLRIEQSTGEETFTGGMEGVWTPSKDVLIMLQQGSDRFIGSGNGTGEFEGTLCGVSGTATISFSAVAVPVESAPLGSCFEFTSRFQGTSGGFLGAHGVGKGTGPFLGCPGSYESKVFLK